MMRCQKKPNKFDTLSGYSKNSIYDIIKECSLSENEEIEIKKLY